MTACVVVYIIGAIWTAWHLDSAFAFSRSVPDAIFVYLAYALLWPVAILIAVIAVSVGRLSHLFYR